MYHACIILEFLPETVSMNVAQTVVVFSTFLEAGKYNQEFQWEAASLRVINGDLEETKTSRVESRREKERERRWQWGRKRKRKKSIKTLEGNKEKSRGKK